MAKSPLLGTAYTALSKNLAHQRCINLFLESVETKSGSEPAALFGCPGLVLALTLPTGPVRAFRVIGAVVYAVAGNMAYSVSASLVATPIGALATASGSVSIVNNPTQVGFFDSVGGYSYIAGVWADIALPFTGAVGSAVYQDGFVVISQPGTFNLWQSNLNDLTTWDALNFTTEDGNAEPVVALVAFNDQIYVFKTYSFCPYVNAGLNGFVFQRLDGIYPPTGCAAPASLVVLSDELLWLGQTRNGQAKIYITNAYEPNEISTYAIENTIDGYSTVSDCTAFAYVQGGHSFAAFNFPSGNETWVVDTKETRKIGVGCWHQRAAFLGGNFNIYAVATSCQFNGVILGGDYSNGNVYVLDLHNYQDNGQTRKWLRSWRATPQAMNATEKCNYVDIECETGIGVPAGTDPQLVFRQSFDDGHSWSPEMYQPAGLTGETANDIRFTRMGSTRRGLNSDRIFELSSTDAFKVALLGAEVG